MGDYVKPWRRTIGIEMLAMVDEFIKFLPKVRKYPYFTVCTFGFGMMILPTIFLGNLLLLTGFTANVFCPFAITIDVENRLCLTVGIVALILFQIECVTAICGYGAWRKSFEESRHDHPTDISN